MSKKILFLIAIAMLAFVSNVSALTVVYVHGTSPDLTKQDAYDYWNGDESQNMAYAPRFVEISRNGLPFFISYRDGRPYVKPQAIQLANQIFSSVSDSQIILLTHSMGGLIVRYIMANPTNDGLTSYQRYQFDTIRNKVKKIITIAGPHMGSPAADLVNVLRGIALVKPVVAWLGYDKPAIDHLTPAFWASMSNGMLNPDTIKKASGERVHVYLLGSRDATAGEPWYNRQFENWALSAIDLAVNFNSKQINPAAGSYYDQYPAKNRCVARYWWGGCKTYANGNGELDNDGMVSAWSGNFGNFSNAYLHKYTSYDSHHSNRYVDSVANWAKQFVY